jgi:death-on-curing protein
MTSYLTAQQVLFVHARLIATTGGEHGVRDIGLLESAVARPQATFAGADLYPDLFHKAAALMESLARNHPFVDGNKRTAITAAAIFWQRNGRHLETTNAELERFTLWVVEARPLLNEVARWFHIHTLPLA